MNNDPTEVLELAARVTKAVEPGLLTFKRMFGGITFLLDGNMLCCASAKGLMVRVGAAAEERALESPHASPCMGTGRRMSGFIMIDSAGIANDRDLARWIALARSYVETLPAKKAGHSNAKKSSLGNPKSQLNRKTRRKR